MYRDLKGIFFLDYSPLAARSHQPDSNRRMMLSSLSVGVPSELHSKIFHCMLAASPGSPVTLFWLLYKGTVNKKKEKKGYHRATLASARHDWSRRGEATCCMAVQPLAPNPKP